MKLADGLGVKAVTTWLPDTYESARDEVDAGRLTRAQADVLGVSELPVSHDLVAPEMAVAAGRAALERAGVPPQDVGMLVHAWVYHQGREKWTVAHFIAKELGLPAHAVPVGVHELCNGGTTGLHIAAAALVADPGLTAAVLTTADRYTAPVWDRWRCHTEIGYGDAATATVLHRPDGTSDQLLLLSLAHSSAFPLEGLERGDSGWTDFPMQRRDTFNTGPSREEFYAVHGRSSLARAARQNVRASVEAALAEAGLAPDDPRIRLITVPRIGPRLARLFYGDITASLKAEYVWLGARTGHVGAGDLLANLADIVRLGLLAPGEFAIVAGAGAGFTWSAAIVQAPGR